MRIRGLVPATCAVVMAATVATVAAGAVSVAVASDEPHGPETVAIDDAGVSRFAKDVDEFDGSDSDRLGDLEWDMRETVDAESTLAMRADDLGRRIDGRRQARAHEERAAADAATARAKGAAEAARERARNRDAGHASDGMAQTADATASGPSSQASVTSPSERTATTVAEDAPASDSWAQDAGYRDDMVGRATTAGSDTDWFLAVDTTLARISALHHDGASWSFVRGWDCDVGRSDEAGRSISLNWPDGTIRQKWPDAGEGQAVNPWMSSVTGDQSGFGIHGGWGHLADYQQGRGPRCTSGGIVCENGPARWVYDTCPVGTRVIVF